MKIGRLKDRINCIGMKIKNNAGLEYVELFMDSGKQKYRAISENEFNRCKVTELIDIINYHDSKLYLLTQFRVFIIVDRIEPEILLITDEDRK